MKFLTCLLMCLIVCIDRSRVSKVRICITIIHR
jgi:hypothetical protein